MKTKLITVIALFMSFLSLSQAVPNITALSNFTGGTSVYLEGYTTPGDGGGGHFYLIVSSASTNNATIFSSTPNPTKRWFRIIDDGKVNVKWFGAKGDGVTNVGTAVFNAKNYAQQNNYKLYFPSGIYNFGDGSVQFDNKIDVLGDGQSSILKGFNAKGSLAFIQSDNVTISDLSFFTEGVGYGHGIAIKNDTKILKNIVLKNLNFKGPFINTVSLFKCTDVKILNCNFDSVKYQIIQAWGYPSNNVLVDGNYSNNCINDFVELNSERFELTKTDPPTVTTIQVASSKNWIITNNIVRNIGSVGGSIESRFIGVTNTDGIIISNNVFDTCFGDSAFHFENLAGNTVISNNTIKNPKSNSLLAGNLIFNVSKVGNDSDPDAIECQNRERTIIFENNIVELESTYTSVCKDLFYSSTEDKTTFQILNNKFYNNSSVLDINVFFKGLSLKLWNIKNNEFYKFNKVIEIAQSASHTNIIDNSFYNCNSGIVINDNSTFNNSVRIEGNLFKNVPNVFLTNSNSKINLLSFQNNIIDNSKLNFNLSSDFLNGFKGNTFLNGSITSYNDKSIKLNVPNDINTVIFDYKNSDYTYLCWVDIVATDGIANRAKCLLRVSRNFVAPATLTEPNPFNNYVQVLDQTRNGNWPLPIFTVDENGLNAKITGSAGLNFNLKVNVIDINGLLYNNEQSLGYSANQNSLLAKTSTKSLINDNFENSINFDEFVNASPNPVKDILKLETQNNVDNIKIYDLNGKLIREITDAKNIKEINLSDLTTGLYIGIFQTEKSKIVKKIIKE